MTNQPTLHATAYKVVADDNLKEIGKIIKITPKHIWIEQQSVVGQPWTKKYKANGDQGYYRTADQFAYGYRMVFEQNPLIEFLLNGVKD